MDKDNRRLEKFCRKMADAGEPQLAVDSFARCYNLLSKGADILIPESRILPLSPGDVTDLSGLPPLSPADRQRTAELLRRVAVIKLSGGLGTSMGLEIPKAAIEARPGHTFLDITARQIIREGQDLGAPIPLVLMTSFSTLDATTRLLESFRGELSDAVPGVFVQHRFPKVNAGTLDPAAWTPNPDLEWNPPGHGDIYAALVSSGMLDSLLARGFHYIFVSNIDNLGARLDPRILAHMADTRCPLLMEVTTRGPADRKGGHLAKRSDSRLVLREVAQCPAEDLTSFQDINRHRFFNTNNIWIDLRALKDLLAAHHNLLPLPLIKNEKNIDPRNPRSPHVYQLESAMGAAIELFDGARALLVGRDRFVPVKRCEDLLVLWSDRFELTDSWEVKANPAVTGPVAVDLDPQTFGRMDQLRGRFPFGAPSLVECESLTVRGDVIFGKAVRIKGRATITAPNAAPMLVPDHAVVEG